MKTLWRYNPITGYWNPVRDVAPGNERAWLDVWQKDEPNANFKVSKRQPKGKP